MKGSQMKEVVPAVSVVLVGIVLTGLILYTSPLITFGDISGCPSGTVRQATAGDVAQFKTIDGSANTSVSVGTCLTQDDISTLGLSNGTAQAIQDLSQNFICPGKQAGYNANIQAASLKEQYVYFSAGQASVNPKFIVCVDKFLNAAKQAGLNPCLTAALRTATAQQASCTDPRNSIVCGKGDCGNLTRINACPHVKGIAVDVNPQPNTASNIDRMHTMAGAYGVGYTVATDLPHIQPTSLVCNGGGTIPPPITEPQVAAGQQPAPQQIASMSTGQTYNQDTICVLSTDPPSSITIPAGTPYPSSCLNGNAPSSVPQGQQAQAQSNGGTQVASNQTTPSSIPGTVSSSQVFPTTTPTPLQATIQTPTLVTNLLTPSSTAALLAALANPQYSTTSTTTPVILVLNPALATNVAQLQAGSVPGVTYAQIPTASVSQTSNGSNPSPAYQTTGTGIIPGTHVPSGSDTFASNSLNTSGGQDSFSQAPQVVAGNASSILNSLKVQLITALSFLSTYTQPFQGNIPSQQEVD